MCHRTKWREAFSYVTNFFNFKWLQISSKIDYTSLGKYGAIKQMVNHYENHYAITNKANMFMNLMYYCEQRNISVFKYVPFTIIFEFKSENENLKNDEIQKKYEEKLENLKKFIEQVNNFVVNYEDIGKYYNEEKYKEEKKNRNELIKQENERKKRYIKSENDKKNYNFEYLVYRDYFKKLKLIEKVSTIYEDNIDSYYRNSKINKNIEKTIGNNTVIQIPKTHYNSKNMWVIKPLNLCRGMCIQIVNNFKQMETALNMYKDGVDYNFSEKVIEDENEIIQNEEGENIDNKKDNINEESKNIENKEINKNEKKNNYNNNNKIYYCNQIIIQKYIENPLLYKGRKCDIRVWALITHQMKVYFFKEGHFKTCSIEYDINSKDAYKHITNYSFQKYNKN